MTQEELEVELQRLKDKIAAIKDDHNKWCPYDNCTIMAILDCPHNGPGHYEKECLCYGISDAEYCECGHEEDDEDGEDWKQSGEDSPEEV